MTGLLDGQLLHVKADGTVAVLQAADVTTLDQMQALVGGHLELIMLPALADDGEGTAVGTYVQLYCNENGKIEDLPFNALATFFVGRLDIDWLAGDVFFAPVDFDT